jgi:hypothetical protein
VPGVGLTKTLPTALIVGGLVALTACASAYALKIEIGKTVVSATASIAPRALPARGDAPVEVSSVTRVKTTDGSPPPTLKELVFVFDKHGSIDTRGLPVCTLAKLAEATPAVARKRCRGAIVGEGTGKAEVNFPDQAPIQISSPLTFFNAPAVGGKPTLIVHGYETVPVAKAVLSQFSIERVSKGRYGFRVKIPVPEIAGGFGAATLAEATIGASWKRGGRTVGYANASCAGGRLEVQGIITFTNGDYFPGTLASPCHVDG